MSAIATQDEDRRGARRWIINETIELIVGDKAYDFQIMDISASGARVVADVDLKPGMKVLLGLPGNLELNAKIIHVQSDGVGIQFEIGTLERTKLFDWISDSTRRKLARTTGGRPGLVPKI